MSWLNSLERRFGTWAIPGLIRVIVAFNAFVYVAVKIQPDLINALTLRPDKVMQGEFWRLVTYIFIPQVGGNGVLEPFWALLYLYFLWLMGEGLEQAWGGFKLNVYYLFGMVGTTVAVLLLGAQDATGVWLNTSLFFAFATLFPNFEILLFFFIPVRIKWLALYAFVRTFLEFLSGSISVKATIAVALANYIIFFGPAWVRQWRISGRTTKRRREFQAAQRVEEDESLHHCKVCGSTEVTSPEKDFRVAADGEEYCTMHLPSRQSSEVTTPLA